MAENPQRLVPVAHQSINARRASRTPNGRGGGGVDLTVKGGDHALYGPRLTTFVFCSCAARSWSGLGADVNNECPPLLEATVLGVLGRGQSLKPVVGHELPEEVRSSAMRAGALDAVMQSGRRSSSSASPVVLLVGMRPT